jgi:hypothetical protein
MIEYRGINNRKRIQIVWLLLILSAGVYFVLALWTASLGNKTKAPQEIHVEEDVLTLQMNPDVLTTALTERASQWCSWSRTVPVFGDIVLRNTATDDDNVFGQIFLTDSVGPIMAREYPHLFEYIDDEGDLSFRMQASKNSVTVPVWLVQRLIECGVLQLPENQ